MGLRRRCLKARSTAPKPIIGKVLAVQLITASNSCKRSGTSAKRITLAPKRSAKAWPRSMVRLAMTMWAGFLAAKWVMARSIISPAPTNNMFTLVRSSNSWLAKRTAAAAMLMLWAPISVLLRTTLATEKLRWNNWLSVVPRLPASSAARTAFFIWPKIWASPSTMLSRPLATRKAWRAASSFCRL